MTRKVPVSSHPCGFGIGASLWCWPWAALRRGAVLTLCAPCSLHPLLRHLPHLRIQGAEHTDLPDGMPCAGARVGGGALHLHEEGQNLTESLFP